MGIGDSIHDRFEAERLAKEADRERKEAALTKTLTGLLGLFIRLLATLTLFALVLGWVEDRWEGVLISGTVLTGTWLVIVLCLVFATWLQRDTV